METEARSARAKPSLRFMRVPPPSASSCEVAGLRSGNRSLEKRRARPGRSPRKARIPIAERGAQGPPQRSKLGDPSVEQVQFPGKQRACLPARDASPISSLVVAKGVGADSGPSRE